MLRQSSKEKQKATEKKTSLLLYQKFILSFLTTINHSLIGPLKQYNANVYKLLNFGWTCFRIALFRFARLWCVLVLCIYVY